MDIAERRITTLSDGFTDLIFALQMVSPLSYRDRLSGVKLTLKVRPVSTVLVDHTLHTGGLPGPKPVADNGRMVQARVYRGDCPITTDTTDAKFITSN